MKAVLCDIDGVLLVNNEAVPGAREFIHGLVKNEHPLLLLTNYPSQTAGDLQNRFSAAGLDVPEECFYTSAMATADFLSRQSGRKAYVIGDGGLTHELYRIGFTITDIDPDFVVLGETRSYNWEMIHKAAQFVARGARFIATNPDVAGPNHQPACGALAAPIERITGKRPFYVGKPSSWMMRAALNRLGGHAESSVIVGDNMDTDILAGVQAGMETILVLSGVTKEEHLGSFAFQPSRVVPSVAQIESI
jgi:NagD protein